MEKNLDLIKFFKNFLIYSPGTIIPAIIGFLTIPLLTKTFDPIDYGNYVLTISIIGVLSLLIESLWGNSLTRYFTQFKNQEKLEKFYDTLNISTIVSIILITAFFICILYFLDLNTELYELMVYGVFLFILLSYFNVLKRILIVKELSKVYSILVVFQTSFGFILGFLLIDYFKLGIQGFIIGTIVSIIITLPFLYYTCFNRIFVGLKFSKEISHKMTIFGLPMILSNLSAWILSLSDRYILNFYWGSFEVGIYSAAYGLSEQSIVIVWNLFMTTSYPLIVKTWENKGEKETQKFISKISRYYLLLTVPMVFGLSILSKEIILIFTSELYYQSYIIVPFVLFGSMLLGLQWWAQISLLLHNKTSRISLAVIFSALINIILNIILIPNYGYIGAAVNTLLAYFVLFIIILILSRKYLSWKFPLISFIKIIISSIIMVISIVSIQILLNQNIQMSIFNLVFEIIIGMIIYIISLFLIQEYTSQEKNILESFFNELKIKLRRLT